GEVIAGIRIHLAGGDGIKPLGRLPVAFFFLGAEIAGPTANRIGLQKHELAIAILLPDLHLRLFFEDSTENRRFLVHILRGDLGDHLFGQGGLCPARGRNALTVTTGQSNRSSNSRRRQQRASEGSFQTWYSPKRRVPQNPMVTHKMWHPEGVPHYSPFPLHHGRQK